MVLIVEDDPDMRALERMALESGGFDVTTANNGAEALRGDERPCVILLDLMMPVMDGLAFLTERRTRTNLTGVPVICLSAGGPELMAEARQRGAAECVSKPTDFDQLCALVARYCGTP
jgi:DNA-binding response OmpR family regulator